MAPLASSQKPNKHLGKKLFYFFCVFIMYGFFSISFVVSKKTLQYGGPLFLTGSRMLVAAGILFLLQVCVDRKRLVGIKGYGLEILLLSVFNIFLCNTLEFWALQYLSCYKTCYVYSLTPFFAAVVSYFTLKEKLGKLKIIGLIVGFLGFLPLFIYKEFAEGHGFYICPAEWALLGAVVSTVIGWTAMRKLTYKHNYPILMANAYSMFLGGLLSFGASWIFEGFSPLPVSNWSLFIPGMLMIALINNIIGYNLYAFFTKKFTVTLMSFIGFITPLLTALIGWFFLKESVSVLFFISYGIVLIGFVIFSREELIYNVK